MPDPNDITHYEPEPVRDDEHEAAWLLAIQDHASNAQIDGFLKLHQRWLNETPDEQCGGQ